jgi:photosystem II stability/assembly factor-like uncharacterized protein
MAFDPQDSSTVYAGTAANGLAYSLDGGDSWQLAKGLNTGKVNSVAVDPKNKCTVYAARANEIYKTETCGRDWTKVFYDPRTDKQFTQILVDWFNPTSLYAGSSDGDIFKSQDAGLSWATLKRVDGSPVTDMAMDPRDSRLLYVATNGGGVMKSADAGTSWTQISKQFGDEYRDARRATAVVIDPKAVNTLYVVSKYGIIKSEDGGSTWKALNLTAPPETIAEATTPVPPPPETAIGWFAIYPEPPFVITNSLTDPLNWIPVTTPLETVAVAVAVVPTYSRGTPPLITKPLVWVGAVVLNVPPAFVL